MRITNILIKLVGALALLALTFSCTDDTYDAPAEGYGFVQFKLVKNGGLTADKEITSRAANADILDSLADAKKIKITLKSAYDVIEQTLALSATNGSDTEMGLWSEKCQLLADHYNIAGYELLDNLGNTLLTYDVESEKNIRSGFRRHGSGNNQCQRPPTRNSQISTCERLFSNHTYC